MLWQILDETKTVELFPSNFNEHLSASVTQIVEIGYWRVAYTKDWLGSLRSRAARSTIEMFLIGR